MNKLNDFFAGFLFLSLFFVFSCQDKSKEELDTILEGKATIHVDETIFPIIEDEAAVFETQYKAKLQLVPQSENELIQALLKDKAKIVVITRQLTTNEQKAFQVKKVTPKVTPFATDAITFIKSKTANDSLIVLQDVMDFVKGKEVTGIKGLVFDNLNSSTARYMTELTGVDLTKGKNIYSFKSNAEVIKYVGENEGMLGVIGMNWIFQPPLELQESVDKVMVMGVKGEKSNEFVIPTQDNLAAGKYPLARRLFIVNCQGYPGLGMGFASFLGGERGQRIILKSGLVPERFPTRNVLVRNKVTKDKN